MRIGFVATAVAAALLAGCVSEGTYQSQVQATQYETALAAQYQQLNTQLQTEIAADQVQIKQLQGKLVVTFVDEILFASGSAEVHSQARPCWTRPCRRLRRSRATGSRCRLYGQRAIGPSLRGRYATNWDLSAARATDVVKYLQSQGVTPSNMVAEGYGEYQPVVDNGTPAGRARIAASSSSCSPSNGLRVTVRAGPAPAGLALFRPFPAHGTGTLESPRAKG